jgi:hypothetical protein
MPGSFFETGFFSPVWIRMWFFRTLASMKAFAHFSQTCGLSPVCTIVCFCSAADEQNDLVHWEQLNGLTSA